jgi:hypothetical protein
MKNFNFEPQPTKSWLPVPRETDELPDHLIALPGGEWAFWRWVCLRGSGFPARLIEQLRAESCADAADELLRLDSKAADRCADAIAAVEAEIREQKEKGKQKQLVKAVKQLKRGLIPNYEEGNALRAIRAYASARQQFADARANFKEVFQDGVRQMAQRIREISADPQIRQAVLLQNRNALSHVLQAFASERVQHKRGFKERQNEELIANYLQRYCLKNDTVGFFGPVGWARFQPNFRGLNLRTGPNLVSTSTIYFEHWGVQALADKLTGAAAFKPWIAPRLLPFFRVEGTILHLPAGNPTQIPPAYAAILEKCDGEKSAAEIARELLNAPFRLFKAEHEVYAVLQQLCARKILSWKVELPYTLWPERRLREWLEGIESPGLRQPAIEALNELEASRDKVSCAVGDPVKLSAALEHLDAVFTRLSSIKPTRSEGAMYAGRTLVYQDCIRDVEVNLGGDLVESLSAPLSLLLASARWLSHQAAAVYSRTFESLYDELTDGKRDRHVDLLKFWARLQPLLFDPENTLLHGVIEDFRRRWAEILQAPESERRAVFRSEDLSEKVEQLFAAPGPGWQLARYHSPDIMIAAENPEAISAGDCFFVLGELHFMTNTCRGAFMLAQHPRPHELIEAIDRDLPGTILTAVPPRNWPRLTSRTSVALNPSRAYHLEGSPDSIAAAPRSMVVPISDVVIENSPDGLRVSTRDGRLSFEIIEAFGELLSMMAVDIMKLIPSEGHTPRITIDRLVVTRESWSLDASALDFVDKEEEDERYLGARRMAHEYGFPRQVFVKIPSETKPFYVDFDSPVYVGILIKMLRRAKMKGAGNSSVLVSEMLPTPEQLWLRDAAQNIYTSELRIVARDLSG